VLSKPLKLYRATVPASIRIKIGPLIRSGLAVALRGLMPQVRRRVPALAQFIDEYQIHHEAVSFVRRSRASGSSTLVFGVGKDSKTWEAVCGDGPLWFIEDNVEWIDVARPCLLESQIVPVTYDTTVAASLQYRSADQIPPLRLPEAFPTSFDNVIVDGPAGDTMASPGRASSILAALQLVKPGGFVLIDDIDRDLETHVVHLVFGRAPDVIIGRGRPVGVYRT
jgi:hypothetical protein